MRAFGGHYDREVDIAWIVLPGFEGGHAVAREEPWGLREVDERTEELVALEYWQASQHLPKELLDALPAHPARNVVIERRPA